MRCIAEGQREGGIDRARAPQLLSALQQIALQSVRRLVAILRRFLQELQDHPRERERHAGALLAQADAACAPDARGTAQAGRALERRPPREHEVERGPERVQIAARVDPRSMRPVASGEMYCSSSSRPRAEPPSSTEVPPSGRTEVEADQVRAQAGGIDDHVRRVQVAVQQAHLVGVRATAPTSWIATSTNTCALGSSAPTHASSGIPG